MSVRSLMVVFVMCLVSWAIAAGALVKALQETHEEREALVAFVCVTIEIRRAQSDQASQDVARRFSEILDELGESCPQGKE